MFHALEELQIVIILGQYTRLSEQQMMHFIKLRKKGKHVLLLIQQVVLLLKK